MDLRSMFWKQIASSGRAGTFMLCILVSSLTAQQLPDGFVLEEFAGGLDRPTALAFTDHDSRIFIAEKSGQIRIVENGELLTQPFYSVETETRNERGLLGIALDPQFEQNQFVYFYHSIKDKRRNRLVRVTAAGNTARPQSEVELFRTAQMWASWHNGGAIIFDEKDKLLLAVGDGTGGAGQRPDIDLALIVRLNRDGSIPEDNPVIDGLQSHLYAWGMRNPYTMASSKLWGKTYFNDVGNEFWEEINELKPGANYGWDAIDGYITSGQSPPANYEDPIHVYKHTEDGLCAIVGAAFYEPGHYSFPTEYHGQYFFMDYCEGIIYYLDPPTGNVKTFATGFDFPNNLAVDHDGNLFVLQLASGDLFRVRYQGNGSPYISRQPKDQIVPLGGEAALTITASGDAPLAFQWSKAGVDIGGAQGAEFSISDIAVKDAGDYTCHVRNGAGEIVSKEAHIDVVEGSAPVLTIDRPPADASYRAGDTIFFSGFAMDAEQGRIPAVDLEWTINFQHNQHNHPALGPLSAAAGHYVVPFFGETDTTVYYRVELTATDSSGLTGSVQRDVEPELVSVYLETRPACVQISVDGATTVGKSVLRSLDRMKRSIDMPLHQVVEDHLWIFDEWQDGVRDTLRRIFTAVDGLKIGADYTDGGFYHTAEQCGVHIDWYSGIGQDTLFYLDQNRQGVNENWDVESPWRWRGDYPRDSFSVKWSGQIIPPIDAEYTFELLHDGYVTFSVGDQILINQELDDSEITIPSETKINLEGGNAYDFEIYYEHLEYISRLQLAWSYGVVQSEVVPNCQIQLPGTTTSVVVSTEPKRFDLYPNPVVESDFQLYLYQCTAKENVLIIYDQLGKIIHTQSLQNFGNTISIKNIPQGVYFAVLDQDGETSTKKFSVVQ